MFSEKFGGFYMLKGRREGHKVDCNKDFPSQTSQFSSKANLFEIPVFLLNLTFPTTPTWIQIPIQDSDSFQQNCHLQGVQWA